MKSFLPFGLKNVGVPDVCQLHHLLLGAIHAPYFSIYWREREYCQLTL